MMELLSSCRLLPLWRGCCGFVVVFFLQTTPTTTAWITPTTQRYSSTFLQQNQHQQQTQQGQRQQQRQLKSIRTPASSSSLTQLQAIGVLVKKAKQAELRQYVEAGMEESVIEQVQKMKQALLQEGTSDLTQQLTSGPLQQSLMKRKGTITVIAEYRRKNDVTKTGMIHEMYDVEWLSPTFREYGASAIAVMADERMGRCTYQDLAAFIEEQRRAKNEVPGSVPVINSDLIIDELQVARTAAYGAAACLIQLDVVGMEALPDLLRAAKAVHVETIVAVSTPEQAQVAINCGARMIRVDVNDTPEIQAAIVADLQIPKGQTVCTIATIYARPNQELQEIEHAWAIRDAGFHVAWICDALYKSGSDMTEHPGAILRSMRSKSSLKWATPKARTGKGEGAREYLGDILM